MPRKKLLSRLAALDPLIPEACLTLLWTCFEEVGLSAVENAMRSRRIHPIRLEAHRPSGRSIRDLLSAGVEDLRAAGNAEDFDLLALRWLKWLDIWLGEGELEDFESDRFTGLDGRLYAVRRRNAFLASHYEGSGVAVRWSAHQGLSLAAYCRNFVVVPCEPVHGLRIVPRAAARWGTPYLHDRLRMESEDLRIMLWPLRTALDYPSLAALQLSSADVPQLRSDPERARTPG